MKIWVLGTGDAFSERRYNTSFVVQSHCTGGNFFHLGVECPHPYRMMLKSNLVEGWDRSFHYPILEEIDHFLISHLHGDHINGLEDVLFYKRFVQGVSTNIYMSRRDLNDLWENRLECVMGVGYDGATHFGFERSFFYNEHSLDEPVQIGPFSVQTREVTTHFIPTIAMIIREGNKSIGFSADTSFDEDLIHWLAQADVIIHECSDSNIGHTTYGQLLTLPAEIKNKIKLIHYCDQFVWEDSEIYPLRDGDVFVV